MNIHEWAALSSFMLVALPLIYAGIKDAKTMKIPNRIHLMLLAVGVLHLFAAGFSIHAVLWAALGMFLGGFPLLILAVITKGKCVGGGDVKLAACAGFVFGGLLSYLVLCAALLLFLFGGLIICGAKKRKLDTPLPFAPFYAAAGILTCAVIFTIEILEVVT
ncbi:MAG: prepilin peptidase [Ethanoligenens sp.]